MRWINNWAVHRKGLNFPHVMIINSQNFGQKILKGEIQL